MTASDFASIAAYLFGSIGGGAALVFALSSWLGKIWAQRIMDSDRAKYLAMVASQNIMDAQDRLVDRIILIANGEKSYVWSEIRELALALLNEIRKDLKFDESPIAYNGLL